MVKYYEGMFLTHNKEARKETEYLAEHVKELIEKAGGEIAQMVRWDERRLAYPIKGVTHGVYYLTYFTGDAATDARLRSEVRLSSLIMRHLTLKLDKLPEEDIETAIELQNRLAGSEREPGDDDGSSSDGGAPRPASRTAAAPVAAAGATATAAATEVTPEATTETAETTDAPTPKPEASVEPGPMPEASSEPDESAPGTDETPGDGDKS